ncbi:TlpA disulfide reductase family protein [Bacillus tianshenii]|nr:TlpA disulfide reductase family protein [Bacillus tianshenii]
MKKIIASIFIMGLIAYGVISAYSDSKEEENNQLTATPDNAETEIQGELKKGAVAPNFTLTTLEGEQMTLQDLKGKKVMVNFWASWCPPCRAEMPEMQEFHENYADKDVVILAVNATQTEKNEADVKQFVEEFGLTFPVLMDGNGKVNTDLYNVVSLPTTYFIDSNGKLQNQMIGAMSYDQMVTNIENLD